jgi:formylglycine-generating enzyme required for sulfatase activity
MKIKYIYFICLLALLSACKTTEEKPAVPDKPVNVSMPDLFCPNTSKGLQIVPSQRMALVIGNDNYSITPLKNPGNDADDMATALEQVNFEVTKKKNLSLNEMKCLIQEFGKTLSNNGGVGLFYFSGHGMQRSDKNYLFPIGATSSIHSSNDLPNKTVNLDYVLNTMKMAKNNLNIIILDACRDLPLTRSLNNNPKGLTVVQTSSDLLIAYSTRKNKIALDGKGRNSPYVKHLKRELVKPNVTIEDMFKRVRVAVKKETGGKQQPGYYSELDTTFCFNGCEKQSRNDDDEEIQQPILPIMKPVESGTYNIPSYLQDWIKDVYEPVIINKPFYIMTREVTVGDFRQYKKYIEGEDQQPLRSISWQQARDYANWLSNKTGKNFKLPGYSQWVAAAVKYAKPEDAITREKLPEQIEPKPRPARPTEVHDLLANLREWTTTSCEDNKYYAVGKDYNTWQQSPKNKLCGDQGYSNVIGFRLILEQ